MPAQPVGVGVGRGQGQRRGADVGARTITILRRSAAVIRYRIGDAEVTLVLQRARDLQRRSLHRDADDLRVEAWQRGPWTCVAVGPAASVTTWLPRVRGT